MRMGMGSNDDDYEESNSSKEVRGKVRGYVLRTDSSGRMGSKAAQGMDGWMDS